ncbi:MAG: galactose mutarotase [Clostridia bacterium]|nr:galactose mutarotase [Clostridia bacterium]
MIEKSLYGKTSGGKDVHLFRITNNPGSYVDLLTYGATVDRICVPDKEGVLADVLIGFDDIEGHETRSNYQGQTVGRYANRIENGVFSIDGTEYKLTQNEKGKTCLHGGGELSHNVWNAIIIDDNAVEMTYTSPDGAEGFPGKVDFKVVFTFSDKNELKIDYSAVSDKKTVINLTNHAYFNLAGEGSGDILATVLKIDADRFTPTDADSIPTGELRDVTGTAFDFREPKPIGRDIHADDEQLAMCRGYDHNFCLNGGDGPAVTAYDPSSGRAMDVYTDLCGVQLYTGNFLDGSRAGKGGRPIIQHAGFCLETQYYPNTPNTPSFPQCTFDAGEKFTSSTMFKFYVKK